jgi:hypothetical protein
MMRVRASGVHEINEVTGKGSRVKVIDSNAMARVELVSLINTNGRSWPCTLATRIRPRKQRVPNHLNVELSPEDECKRVCLTHTFTGTNLEHVIRREMTDEENMNLRVGMKSCSINA